MTELHVLLDAQVDRKVRLRPLRGLAQVSVAS